MLSDGANSLSSSIKDPCIGADWERYIQDYAIVDAKKQIPSGLPGLRYFCRP